MLRQLAKLTRRVPAAGVNALAVAVYADAAGETLAARESGPEGVACVDDAARAIVLLSHLYAVTGNAALRSWALGLLEFVIWMHAGEGRWINFIVDWEGTRNSAGLTSAPGDNFWQARATVALASAEAHLGADTGELLDMAVAAATDSRPPSDVRALHVMAAIKMLRADLHQGLPAALANWCGEIAACQIDGMLMNSPDERGRPHLWGHVQEGVLEEAAAAMERSDLSRIAQHSALAVFEKAIESGFDLACVQPYDVQSAVYVMDRLSSRGSDLYPELARKARAWFRGRNPAGAPVYLAEQGLVADGIDGGVVNRHSGAEANICGGLALAGDPAIVALAAAWPARP